MYMTTCSKIERHESQPDATGGPRGHTRRIVVFSHWSALLYYRLSNAGLLPAPRACEDCSLEQATANLNYLTDKERSLFSISTADLASRSIYIKEDVRKVVRHLERSRWQEALAIVTEQPYMVTPLGTIDVLVPKGAHRNGSSDMRVHQCGAQLPDGSFRRISAHLYIVSPELLYVQMANLLQEPHLVAALACELAGTYSLLPADMVSAERILRCGKSPIDEKGWLRGDGYCDALPLTSIDKLKSFVAESRRLFGRNAAHNGLTASVDNCASPFETHVVVSLALKRMWGGAGCGVPEVNKDVLLSERDRKLAGKRKLIPDAVFTAKNGKRIVVEPGGWEWHSGKDAMTKDNTRRLVLEGNKYEVIVVPWENFEDPNTWLLICNRIACHLEKNFHRPTDEMMDRWRHVHHDFCNTDLLKGPT